MKMAGIIRYVDDMGRVVIPNIIRQQLGIQAGTALEFTVKDDNICLVKVDDDANADRVEELVFKYMTLS